MDLNTPPVTFDAGILIAVDRGDRTAWNDIKRMIREGTVPVVPTPVIAEAWRGARQARMGQVLRLCRVEPLDEQTARQAGELCGRAGTSDPVDAVVMASAARRGGYVFTSDRRDLSALAAHLGREHRPLAVREVPGTK